jgi:hypothetical protein
LQVPESLGRAPDLRRRAQNFPDFSFQTSKPHEY